MMMDDWMLEEKTHLGSRIFVPLTITFAVTIRTECGESVNRTLIFKFKYVLTSYIYVRLRNAMLHAIIHFAYTEYP